MQPVENVSISFYRLTQIIKVIDNNNAVYPNNPHQPAEQAKRG
jgi:hypothetical protein